MFSADMKNSPPLRKMPKLAYQKNEKTYSRKMILLSVVALVSPMVPLGTYMRNKIILL